jgi:hypothetical protein
MLRKELLCTLCSRLATHSVLSDSNRMKGAQLVGVVLLALAGSLTANQLAIAGGRRPSMPLKTLYTADRHLCAAVDEGISRAQRSRPDALYISEAGKAFFSVEGLSEPHWLPNSDPAVAKFPTGETRFIRGDVAGDGVERLLAVQQTQLGAHGDFVTSVWLAKPRRRVSMLSVKHGGATSPVPNPDDIELLEDFSRVNDWWGPGYTVARLTNGKMGFSPTKRPTAEVANFVESLFGASMPQEAIVYNGTIYIVAGVPLSGLAIVYRFERDLVEIKCVSQQGL